LSTEHERESLSAEELEAEGVTALPDKEVASILDLNADLDLALDVAAPIDLAVAANANVAAPIDAAVGANILSAGSSAQAMADQGAIIEQGIAGQGSNGRQRLGVGANLIVVGWAFILSRRTPQCGDSHVVCSGRFKHVSLRR